MGEIINLNRVRKERERAARNAKAKANRAKFGRTKSDKSQAEDSANRLDKTVDGARLDDPDPGPQAG